MSPYMKYLPCGVASIRPVLMQARWLAAFSPCNAFQVVAGTGQSQPFKVQELLFCWALSISLLSNTLSKIGGQETRAFLGCRVGQPEYRKGE